MLKVDVSVARGVCRVVLNGELDVETVPQLQEVVGTVRERTLEVDLSGVSFVDSTGLKSLLDINNDWRQKGGKMLILRPQPDVAEVMRLVGLDRLLEQNTAPVGEEREE
ncbi:anti-sigma B factor antagonist/stage II sporulation protein AA (anti-sigma F factor antagonist) [Thermosediminibacter litoriperuensis]|uniref:Anti-sigma factor antagonist n=1 Tax=Thermosediminibacter litoriperuensis TaxID=291989 RepID=A0A5S5B0A9_9FIRM|nr:anti-sigma B factor antagonist/stage II sporulation protein AA (anti-sigma F factor antagonist) [Thermosediminibacter litoriperuensis]